MKTLNKDGFIKGQANYYINGKCSNCDECCIEFLPLTKGEVETIRQYVQKHNIPEQRHFNGKDLYLTCPFRDSKNKRCSVYPVRPWICRKFRCNQSKKEIEDNKIKAHRRAFYNHMEPGEEGAYNIASLHGLIYHDYEWEASALWGICDKDTKLMQALISRCFVKYK